MQRKFVTLKLTKKFNIYVRNLENKIKYVRLVLQKKNQVFSDVFADLLPDFKEFCNNSSLSYSYL